MVFWGYFHSYWSYIKISSYSILGYLHSFRQCLHWFYPLIHLGFHPLPFLLLQLLVSSNVQIIIHKLVPLQYHQIPLSDISILSPNSALILPTHPPWFSPTPVSDSTNSDIIQCTKALTLKNPICLYIYLNFWFICYISFIKLDK